VHDFDNEMIDLSKISDILAKIQRNNFSGSKIRCLNIIGGEPTLHPHFYEILEMVKNMGIPIWITTNGSTINSKNITAISQFAEGISIPVDSISNTKEKHLGRGFGDHTSNVLKITDLIHDTGIELGVNTIVTKTNCSDNLISLIHRINPHRWDVFQRLPGLYQNNAFIDEMANDHEFNEFVRKHSHVRLRDGIKPSFSKTEDILKSYFILSTDGFIMDWNEISNIKINKNHG
jgi:radical S-adenosyl methionine domain-containing protein 2